MTAALVLAVLSQVAAAAAASAPAYGTRDQVRQCAKEQDQLEAMVAERQRQHVAHDAALAQVQAEGEEITRRQDTVDAGDAAAVRALNEFVQAHNARVDVMNQEAQDSLAAVDRYNAAAQAHNRRCAGMLIRAEDLAVVTRERAHAGAASAAASRAAR